MAALWGIGRARSSSHGGGGAMAAGFTVRVGWKWGPSKVLISLITAV